MSSIPTITRHTIRTFVGEQNFLKGQQYIEHLITGHGRGNYQVACSYLIKIRSLYEKLDEAEERTTYIALLRKRHSRLRTLKEELAATDL